MPVHVVQPMVQTIESILCGDLGLKIKDVHESRQFYEKQMELFKCLKSTFYPENHELLNNSQLYPTANTSFTLSVSELHSIIPLGRTAGALREGWTGIMRDHLRRIIPHTTWYFKRSAFSHPDTRKRAAPLFKCEAVCAERTCPNTIKMCATKSDPLRVNVKFGQGICIHTMRKRIIQSNVANVDCKLGNSSSVICENKGLTSSYACLTPSPTLLQSAGSLRTTQTPIIQCPPSLMAPSTCDVIKIENTASEIMRPVALRMNQEDRKRSYSRLRSSEHGNAPSAFHIVSSSPKRGRVEPSVSATSPGLQPLIDQALQPLFSPDFSCSLFNLEIQRQFTLERGIAT